LFIGKPLLPLQKFGGAEIAALVGGMLECSDRDVPILVDGFMVTTAVLFACQIDPTVTRLLLFATQSTEKGQAIALMEIDEIARLNNIPALVTPALNMYLRMGEATGALLAIPLVRSACAIVSELATLNELLGIA
jgi:nicotinate-nucleotide--dimethylbenzimidazole phosphoribosyltransferase